MRRNIRRCRSERCSAATSEVSMICAKATAGAEPEAPEAPPADANPDTPTPVAAEDEAVCFRPRPVAEYRLECRAPMQILLYLACRFIMHSRTDQPRRDGNHACMFLQPIDYVSARLRLATPVFQLLQFLLERSDLFLQLVDASHLLGDHHVSQVLLIMM